ncbi:MAG: 3-deoxy-manno-octulosonate cytidylyltransferase [Promethearchaeota archaeon]
MTRRARVLAVIPARFGSTRFPGKVLADIGGKPMVQHVYERASRSSSLDELVVAVDDERVADVVRSFGGEVEFTSPEHSSGTDRVAEVAERRAAEGDLVVNVQADEPFLDAAFVDEAVRPLLERPGVQFSTVMHVIDDPAGYDDPGVVKVVRDSEGFGLYFSRAKIPYPRYADGYKAFEHLGIYAYRREALLRFVSWGPAPLELVEGLEMLRILENGERIYVAESARPFYALSVDTPEDLDRARRLYEETRGGGGPG